MILLDFVADENLVAAAREATRIRRSGDGCGLRRGASAPQSVFPDGHAVAGDWTTTTRSGKLGVPSIDLIDFDYACWHRTCDNLSQVSKRSLDAVGETVYELLRSF